MWALIAQQPAHKMAPTTTKRWRLKSTCFGSFGCGSCVLLPSTTFLLLRVKMQDTFSRSPPDGGGGVTFPIREVRGHPTGGHTGEKEKSVMEKFRCVHGNRIATEAATAGSYQETLLLLLRGPFGNKQSRRQQTCSHTPALGVFEACPLTKHKHR